MKFLHNKSTRNIILAAAICIVGFLMAYLSGGMLNAESVSTPPQEENPSLEAPAETPEETPSEETPAEDEEEAEAPAVEHNNSAANYYVRLDRGLSSSEEALILENPSQLKSSVEYRSKEHNKTMTDAADIEAILSLLQNAARLPDETTIISVSNSHDVTLTLPYSDGYGNLYIFEGYINNGKKTSTLIQDNSNHLYQAKAAVIDQLYDLLKPVETSLDAERINVYSCRNYEKGSLQAQSKNSEDFALLLTMLNSLEKQGSSLDLDDPDHLITLLPRNSVSEDDYCYLWLDGKQLKIAFADDSITVYEASEVTSSQMKKWIKEHGVK